jgi:hypothetical protein
MGLGYVRGGASETGARQAQSLGLNVRQGTVQDARYEDGFFDVIRLSNVVEQLPIRLPRFEKSDAFSNLKVWFI